MVCLDTQPLVLALSGPHSVDYIQWNPWTCWLLRRLLGSSASENAGGLPARAILKIFRPRGGGLSEATLRKYVQAGLLPRSRRVGRKGKHQGSVGLYPEEAVRASMSSRR
uniref:HTH merR-type domain-containing protein n=1 Tax=Myxococcus xanthus TaxID=34 RepID=Q9XBP7_MYXXA|nr:unknown [Myxococcus xanthus DZF1]